MLTMILIIVSITTLAVASALAIVLQRKQNPEQSNPALHPHKISPSARCSFQIIRKDGKIVQHGTGTTNMKNEWVFNKN